MCMFAFLSFAMVTQAATVKKVRVLHTGDSTRIVLNLDEPAPFNAVVANNPTRLILVLRDSDLDAAIDHLALAGTPIEIVRESVINQNDLRLVFDLKNAVTIKSFVLKKQDGNDDRIVIDLLKTDTATALSAKSASTKSSGRAPLAAVTDKSVGAAMSEPVDFENTNAAGVTSEKSGEKSDDKNTHVAAGRPVLIMIDAGHGGEDTGALGPNNMREKDVTLAIAKELERIVNAQPGYSARMTRSSDKFVVLQKRRDLARDVKADIFISIHADSFTDASAFGASVFALSRKGATSEMARFLAQRENESDLVGRVGGVSLEDKDAMLAGVLVDLSMTATVNSSLQLGSNVLNSIAAMSPLHARHVEQAGFVVLKSPDVPSILVETGFISNKTESKKLASTNYREQMAQAIFKGVKQYFAQHPVSANK